MITRYTPNTGHVSYLGMLKSHDFGFATSQPILIEPDAVHSARLGVPSSSSMSSKKKKKGAAAFAAGGIAGVVDTCFTMPLDTIKTAMQIQGTRSPITACRGIVGSNGVGGLYAGFAPFCVQAAGKAAIRFYAYELICQLFDSVGIDRARNPTISALSCGLLAGAAEACIWTAPSERIKVMQQSAAASGAVTQSSLATARELIAKQGVRALYVGTVPTAARQSTSVAVRFCLYEKIRDGLASSGLNPSLVSFLAGGFGGAASVVVNNPVRQEVA